VAWLDDQIKSKERAALAAEVRVKDLQAALAASESTDLDLLKKWTAESAAFEKLNHQIARLQIQKAKAETAVPKEQKSAKELIREKIRALKAAQ
jgi:predicted aconitase